jgi:TolB protein
MNADGSGVEQLTEGNFHDAKPSWSPDGRALLMSSSANFPGWDIYQLDLETKKRRRKTGGKGTFCRPDWRPNGEWFSYTHSNGEGFNLWLEPLNGNPTRITHYAGKDYDVRWIDNDSLIFVRNRGGEDNRYALILLRLSNGKAVQLTDGSDSLRDPTWTR